MASVICTKLGTYAEQCGMRVEHHAAVVLSYSDHACCNAGSVCGSRRFVEKLMMMVRLPARAQHAELPMQVESLA